MLTVEGHFLSDCQIFMTFRNNLSAALLEMAADFPIVSIWKNMNCLL